MLRAVSLSLLLSAAVVGQSSSGTPRIMQGPMLGAVSPSTITVWVRLSGPYGVSVEYGEVGDERVHRSAVVSAKRGEDWVVKVQLEGLRPATRYRYRVLVDGRVDKYHRAVPDFEFRTAPAAGDKVRFRVAFGSCARFGQDRQQKIWRAVSAARPDLFLWLGDNIYGDSLDPGILAEEYRRQRDLGALRPVLRSIPQLATWDDHDFGLNNNGKAHVAKEAALTTFSRYWANPGAGSKSAPGVFFRYSYGGVDFFFLDVRYHRDANDAPDGPGKSMLGPGQLEWLRAGLLASRAPFKVLVSGSGWSSAKGPGGDSWAAFLHERDALFDFIRKEEVPGVVLLSGDTHVAELNCIPWSTRGGYDFYDLVSSPLAQYPTDSWMRRRPEMRIRQVWDRSCNFGQMDFDLRGAPTLRYVVVGPHGDYVMPALTLRAEELVNGVTSWPGKIAVREMRLLEQGRYGSAEGLGGGRARLPQRGICAHRGASVSHPENTLPALREAVRLGAHMIEVDVRAAKDGQLVLMHDATLDRTTDGRGAVAEHTLAQLRELDAGVWKGAEFRGTRVPTLAEALAVVPPNVWLNLHLKPQGGNDVVLGRGVARSVVARGRRHQVLLACGRAAARGARMVAPGIRICHMGGQRRQRSYVAAVRRERAAFAQILRPLAKDVRSWCRDLRGDGILTNFYGSNDPAELGALFAAGIDFVLVDDLVPMLAAAERLGIERLRPVPVRVRGATFRKK